MRGRECRREEETAPVTGASSQTHMFDAVPKGHPTCMMMKAWGVSGGANGLA